MNSDEPVSLDELRRRIGLAAGTHRIDAETLDALALGFTDPATATKPIERGLGEVGVLYAWRSEDADVVKTALDLLASVPGLLGGNVVDAGKKLHELLTFWVRLRRNRVRVADPKQVAVLLELKRHPPGASAGVLLRAINGTAGRELMTLDEIEEALDHLTKTETGQGTKPLVLWDGQVWKCLV